MPAVALSRAGARVVESGPGGENLAAGAWQRLEALPDPRSPRGRIYPLACLIAIAVCAFTAAGNDRLTAVGQWTRRASQADLARLRAPWDPVTGRYRAPDEKTIRVVLDRLDPRALTRALLGPRPRRGAAAGCPRPACAATGPGAPPRRQRRWPAAGYGLWPWTARPPGEPAAPTAPGCISSVSPSTAAPPGPPRSRRQAQRDQPLHRPAGTPGPGRGRGDLRCPAHGAGEPGLADRGEERPLHRRDEAEPAAAACPGQDAALAAGPGRQPHPRHRARPHRDPHPQDRARQPPGPPRRPPGHQDHPLAAGHRHRQGLPRDRLRHHQPDQRPGHRATWPGSSASTGPSRRTTTSGT